MEKGIMEEEQILLLDWRIKDFSCWNQEIHEKVIASSKSRTHPNFWLELYPRGLSGLGQHMVVRLYCVKPWVFSGDLSYIGSDGSPLFTQQVNSLEKLNFLDLPPGPEFEKVVSQIRQNEALHKDRLTLRYRTRENCNFTVYMCTSVEKWDVSLKISPKLLDSVGTNGTLITTFQNPFDDEISAMILYAWKVHCSEIKLVLEPVGFVKKIFVRIHMVALNSDDEVQRTEKKEHLFRGRNKWTFFDSLEGEVIEKPFALNLHIKIIPSKKHTESLILLHYQPQEVAVKRSKSCSSTAGSTKLKNPLTVLSKELMCLYQGQDFSDFQLKCGDVTFPVHKNILSARSPVFKIMLSCDMREAASGCMDIEDLDPSTLARFLTFLYTGVAENLHGESAAKLYYAADKYQVPTLKRECARILCGNVSISNVCDILSLANKHQDEQLTSVAHNYILKNYNDVLSSEEWASFMRNESLLAVETVTHFAKKKYVKMSGSA